MRVLVGPQEHISSTAKRERLSDTVAKRLFEVWEKLDVDGLGYAFRTNDGPEVFHLHAHVIGDKRVGMP